MFARFELTGAVDNDGNDLGDVSITMEVDEGYFNQVISQSKKRSRLSQLQYWERIFMCAYIEEIGVYAVDTLISE